MITEQTPKRRLELYEVLDLFSKAKNRSEKVKVLQQHDSVPLRDYIRCVFDDRIVFNLPEGAPPYTANKPESVPSTWHKQNTKLQYFVKGLKGDGMSPIKREKLFISVLESVHPKDADVLVGMINKKPTTKGLTKKLVQEAFPNLVT